MSHVLAHLASRLGVAIQLRGRPRLTSHRLLAAASLALLASACSVTPVPTDVATTGMPNPEQALRQSMHQVDAEMAELGRIRGATVGAAYAPVVPEDLQRIVDFTWSGSLDKGVAKLAQSIGYTFYTTLPPGAAGVDVAINVQRVSALEAFRALGQGAGARATVEVDPIHHAVQVIHHA